MKHGHGISGIAGSGASTPMDTEAGASGMRSVPPAGQRARGQITPHHSLAARPGGPPQDASEPGTPAPRGTPPGWPSPGPDEGHLLQTVMPRGWRRWTAPPMSRLGNPAPQADAAGTSSIQKPMSAAKAERPGLLSPHERTDFSRPSDHPTFSFLEMDSLTHLMRLLDGTASVGVRVNLHGIDEARFRSVMHAYGQTRDMATVFSGIPPGSISIGLQREQIEAAANAYLRAVDDNNKARERQAAAPDVISLNNCTVDPVHAAYVAIGGTAFPRSVFDQYISPQGLTEQGRRELERLSGAGSR